MKIANMNMSLVNLVLWEFGCPYYTWTSLVAQTVKHLSIMWETRVPSLGREDLLEKEVATHSSVLAWRILGTGEPGGLWSMGSHRVGQDYGSSALFKTSLNIRKFTVHILLKPGLENFEHYFTSLWHECNCVVVWAFFGIAFLWDWNENWPFPVLWPLLSFPNLLACWVQHFHSIVCWLNFNIHITFQSVRNETVFKN